MKSARPMVRPLSALLLGLAACFRPAGAVENVAPPSDLLPAPSLAMNAEKAKPAIVVALEKACDGLLMPSETDAPFKVVFFEREMDKTIVQTDAEAPTEAPAESVEAALSIQELAKLAGAPSDATIETRDLTEFFEVATTIEDWMNDEEKATAKRFAELLEVLQTLKNPQVVVWGEAEKQVAILGEAEGAVAGVMTLVVET